MNMWSRWRQRRSCFHHDHTMGQTWITGTLIDTGTRKMWSCSRCGRTWFS